MPDIMDARTLRRLNRLKKRELNSTVRKLVEPAVEAVEEPVRFIDMPWYKLNLNMLLDGEPSCMIKPEPLYVCRSCYEYNTAYSTDFVLVNNNTPIVVKDDEEVIPVDNSESTIVPVDNSDSKSSNSSWTDVSSLKEDEVIAVKLDFSGTPVDLSGAVVDVSGTDLSGATSSATDLSGVDISGAVLRIATVREACAPCCTIS